MRLPFKSNGSNIACAIQISRWFPPESKKRNGFPSPLYSVRFPRGIPLFYPAGMLVLSSISVVSSTNSCSIGAVRVSSHTPAFVQARNRLYTLCHGPNRSGRSRHGIRVFSQYRIALSISRLLFPGRPPCGFFSGGNLSLILFHCPSPISCLFMGFILSY